MMVFIIGGTLVPSIFRSDKQINKCFHQRNMYKCVCVDMGEHMFIYCTYISTYMLNKEYFENTHF